MYKAATIVSLICISIMATHINHQIEFQPKQMVAFRALEDQSTGQYIFYGGAKFGGKSYLARGKEIARRLKYPGTTGVIIRKTFPELLANHIRKFFIEYPFVKDWYKAGEKAIHYPTGSITEFRHLAATMDVYNYQGIEYDDITLDEATQHEEEVFKIIKTSLRMDPRVKARNPDFAPKFLLTGNPGGVGHAWVKRLFIDRQFNPEETPEDFMFIPAKYKDNPRGVKANPQYIRNLQDLPEDLRRAYMDGDWDIFVGQFFSIFRRDIHVIEPIHISPEWSKLFALDWGYDPHPFHAGWYTIDWEGNVYKYRELAGFQTTPEDVARQIVNLSRDDDNLYYGVGDTQMWAQNPFSKPKQGKAVTDRSIADQINAVLAEGGMTMEQANKDRINGWTALKSLMQWEEGERQENGTRVLTRKPKYYIFSTCTDTIAAYPNQIHSQLKPEDMMKQDGDDPCDTDRYAIMHISRAAKPERPKTEMEQFIESITVPTLYDDDYQENWDDI